MIPSLVENTTQIQPFIQTIYAFEGKENIISDSLVIVLWLLKKSQGISKEEIM